MVNKMFPVCSPCIFVSLYSVILNSDEYNYVAKRCGKVLITTICYAHVSVFLTGESKADNTFSNRKNPPRLL